MTTTVQRSQHIRVLNDNFRSTFVGGQVVMTVGVSELPMDVKATALLKVKSFNDFTGGNDPYGEHDFGSFQLAGETIYWKIDYYDSDTQFGSENPANPAVTTRVLTIMLAHEYQSLPVGRLSLLPALGDALARDHVFDGAPFSPKLEAGWIFDSQAAQGPQIPATPASLPTFARMLRNWRRLRSEELAMTLRTVPLSALCPSKDNPRRRIDNAAIASLAESIKVDGVLQNLVVEKMAAESSGSLPARAAFWP